MKKLMFVAIVLLSVHSLAEVKIKKSPMNSRKPSSNQNELGSKTFQSFLKCSAQPTVKDKINCARPLFSEQVNSAQLVRFSEALSFPTEYTEPFECEAKQMEIIQMYEKPGSYDTVLCFETNLSTEEVRVGIVFFKNENRIPKILKLKM